MASNAGLLREATKALIDGLGLQLNSGGPIEVKVRKRPDYRKGDGDGVIVVAGRAVGREVLSAEDGVAYLVKYDITVAVYVPNQAKTIPDDPIADTWRQEIRLALDQPGAMVGSGFGLSHIDILERPFFAPEALAQNMDYAAIAFSAYVIEGR